eukprot:CAMPEP_0184018130 /NCGR_PEP_ID=MMETSP0954-20121128/7964_1 /TAXON_ID=627963 /ORGANISM="Aplanochytrium sp, Strain PBS07" /LENGTH=568 /DNA_ID=CAMNT_0026299529 /DNA_START=65 /DNA_END=1768 /DNA_ORIENTATION=+
MAIRHEVRKGGRSVYPLSSICRSLNQTERYFVLVIVFLLLYSAILGEAPSEPIQIGSSTASHIKVTVPELAKTTTVTDSFLSLTDVSSAENEDSNLLLENMYPQFSELTEEVERIAKDVTFPSDRDLQVIFLGLKNRPLWFFSPRKHGYEAHKFNTRTLARFENLGFMFSRMKSNAGYYQAFDSWVCLLKYYCFDKATYKLLESAKGNTNRIFGSKEIWSTKLSYCSTLRESLRATTEEGREWIGSFTFMCWILPTNFAALEADIASSNGKYIVKPAAAQAGEGIYLHDVSTMGLKGLKGRVMRLNPAVVQPYLSNPLLINKKKWDMRIYVTVTSVVPLRAYMHSKGFIRFAYQNYSNDEESRTQKSNFLTNLSVNNKLADTNDLTWVFSELREYLGDKAAFVFSQIDTALARMLLTSEKGFRKFYDTKVSTNFSCVNCYQNLGIDVILDDNLTPYIIEINGNPTFNFKAEKLNDEVSQLHEDTVRMLYNNVNIFKDSSGKNDLEIAAELMQDLSAIATKDDNEFKWLTHDQISYLVRSRREQQEMGGFRRIYPQARYCEEDVDENQW